MASTIASSLTTAADARAEHSPRSGSSLRRPYVMALDAGRYQNGRLSRSKPQTRQGTPPIARAHMKKFAVPGTAAIVSKADDIAPMIVLMAAHFRIFAGSKRDRKLHPCRRGSPRDCEECV